jgi:hypothetical protein
MALIVVVIGIFCVSVVGLGAWRSTTGRAIEREFRAAAVREVR